MLRRNVTRGAIAVVSTLLLSSLLVGCGSSGKSGASGATTTTAGKPSGPVRGFDGTTITVASLGIKGQLPANEWGVKARIERFNSTNEIPGVKLNYTEFADDKLDPATALSEARRLVTEEKVFGLVGDLSANNPAEYFAQQKVPYFGYAFDNTYCSNKPTKDLWGFGFTGCLVPDNPSALPDNFGLLYDYAKQKLGKDKPTVAFFSSDNQSGRNTAKFGQAELVGAGFDVKLAKGILPPPPISDYTPYAQQVLTADGGKAPDVIVCFAAVDCIPMYKQVVANHYQGIFFHTLWSDALIKAMNGSVVGVQWANPTDSSPAVDQMKADLKAVNPDQAVDIGVIAGYFSTSMFIDALKIVAKKGKGAITPQAVRDAASTMTFKLEGLVGPTTYPAATVKSPGCSSLMIDDGTQWKTITPFTCSSRSFTP